MDTDDYYLQYFSSVEILPPSLSALFALFSALLLLSASAFISSSEIAFFSLTPQDKQEIDEEEDTRDTTIKSLLAQSEHLLATILIGNNLVNVSVVVLLSYFMSAIFVLSPILDFVLQSVILTFLLLLFGEIMPKIYASHHTLKMARRAASPLATMQRIFRPLANLLVNSTQLVNRYMSPRSNISIDEISQALKMTDVQEGEEKELLEGIVTFGDKTVDAVMTPRVDMVDIDIETDFVSLMAYIVEHGYSRIPVYEDNEDTIKGILYIKDLLPHLKEDATFAWQSLLRTPYFVPENKRIDNLLEEFRAEKTHMAIVVDEFGGTCGLITMEDIIEEIVGEISDEYDEEETQYRKLDENNFIFEGKILLNDFFRITGIEESAFEKVSEDSETLAGLILEIKEDFPKQKEHICYDRYKFIVLELNNRRITKVKLCILPEEDTI